MGSLRKSALIRTGSRRAVLAVAGTVAAILTLSAQEAPRSWTAELQMTVKRINQVAVSPDGRQAAVVVSEARMDGEQSEWLSQIHVARTDGSRTLQLTRGDKSATWARWSPDGESLAFISARSGKPGVWRIWLQGGEAEKVTDEKGSVSAFEWAPDGKSIAFVMTDPKTDDEEKAEKEKRDWRTIDENIKYGRLYVVTVDGDASSGRSSRRLTTADYHVTDLDWAPDGQSIVFSHQPSPKADDWTKSDVSVVTTGNGAVKPLAASTAAEQSPRYSPDGKWIAFAKSVTPPSWAFHSIVHLMPAGGGESRALAETADGQPTIVGWSTDGSRVFFTESEGVIPRLFALPVDGKPASAVESQPLVVSAASLGQKGRMVGFVSQWSNRAPEAFVASLEGDTKPTQVTHVQDVGSIATADSEAISWNAPDGQRVEGILTYPAGYQKGTRAPLLVVIHGGPTGVFSQTFIGAASPYPVATFAARGYAILRCNVRGSSGYGSKFRHANLVDWGGGDYRDIMSGVDHVVQMGVADPERLGVMGWSYGGYMTSWILTQTKRFKAASVGAGVTNLMSFTGTSDIPSFLPYYFGGEHWDKFDAWRSHSAMFNVKGVSTPTLIQHGEADPRVPVSQGYEFYNALRRQGVTTKMTVYPRQPHGFEEPKMTLDLERANLDWFDRFLGRTATTSSSKP